MRNAYRPTKLPKARRVVKPINVKSTKSKKSNNNIKLIDNELEFQQQQINKLKLLWKQAPISAKIVSSLILLPFSPIFLIILGFRFITNKLIIPTVKEFAELDLQPNRKNK